MYKISRNAGVGLEVENYKLNILTFCYSVVNATLTVSHYVSIGFTAKISKTQRLNEQHLMIEKTFKYE